MDIPSNVPTPTTEQVKAIVEDMSAALFPGLFDRWLEEHDAEKWDEGFDAGERDVMQHGAGSFDTPCIPNPYRKVR
jgi:hypothetical protein